MTEGVSDFGRELLACAVDGTDPDEHPLRHVSDLAPRRARSQPWPQWADPDVVRAFVDRGITEPWSHQVGRAPTSPTPAATWCSAPAPRRASRWPISCRS